MTKGNVLTHLALSPIQYKSTLSTIDTSAKDTAAAAAAAAAAAKDIGKEGGGDGTTPTWQIVDLRSMDGGFFIAEVGRFSRGTTHFFPFLYYVTSYCSILSFHFLTPRLSYFSVLQVCYTTARPATIRVAVAMKVSPYVAEVPSAKDKEDRPDPLQRKGSVKGGNNIPSLRIFSTHPLSTLADISSHASIHISSHVIHPFQPIYAPFPSF